MFLRKNRNRTFSSSRWARFAAAGISLAAAALLAAFAGEKQDGKQLPQAAQQEKQAAQPATGGFRAFIDPATGKLRDPEPAEAAALGNQVSLSTLSAPLPSPVYLRGGGVGVRLRESQMVYSVARIGRDGKLVMDCVTGREQAEALLKKPAGGEALDVR